MEKRMIEPNIIHDLDILAYFTEFEEHFSQNKADYHQIKSW
jgi:hypothetical protein